ncbi:MAG: biopolymer transporter ExbD [Akkermansiaceae bacterium]|nr:biopolymer transporter ExbD [Akkermansiaceae bacterium]
MPVRLQSTSGDEGDEARIEIIPLIDIMFFLLAAFMLVSLSMTQLHRVPVSLPDASTGIPDTSSPTTVIAIDANGLITLDQRIITLSEITTYLKECKEPKKSRVLISADAEARHKQVLGVLNSIREAGVEKVSFESAKNHP